MLIDALGLERPTLWGHSDGAVIAALLALASPDRVGAVIGARDSRAEPGELDAIREALAHSRVAVLADGGHSPHSEHATADRVTSIAAEFLAERESLRSRTASAAARSDVGPLKR